MPQVPATLLIPDISGFSHFVTHTALEHSQHIIAELLGALIDANELELIVSEVEGDAVLFYRFGDAPPLASVVQQTARMFTVFHSHLQRYERDRLCDCEACTTTQQLSLKVIAHYGSITAIDVRNHHQLVGRDVIVAHRLLKNEIESDEYVLLTDQLVAQEQSSCRSIETEFDWVECKDGIATYDAIGQVRYSYFLLSPLCARLQLLPGRKQPERFRRKLSIQTIVDAPLKFTLEHLADLGLRHHWMRFVASVVAEDAIPRLGSAHQCFLPGMALHIETSRSAVDNGRVEFVESVTDMPMMLEANVFSTLERRDDGRLDFTLDVHYRPSFFGRLMLPLLKPLMRSQFLGNALRFKRFVEARYSAQTKATRTG
jgi:hypothetical protein